MKRIGLLCLPALMFLSPGCKKSSPSFELGIDVQQNFNNDLVQVYVDGVRVINKQLTSGIILAYCGPDGKVLFTKSEGRHQIKVVVNNATTFTDNFNLTADLYIGINYYPDQTVHLIYSDHMFMYR